MRVAARAGCRGRGAAAVWAVVVPRSVSLLEGRDHRGPRFWRGKRLSARSMPFLGRNCPETRFLDRERARSAPLGRPL